MIDAPPSPPLAFSGTSRYIDSVKRSITAVIRRAGSTAFLAAGLVLLIAACGNGPFSSDTDALRIAGELNPDDPYFLVGSQWYLGTINAPEAWRILADRYEVGIAAPARVAVIDEIIDTSHEDLREVLTGDGYNFVTDAPVMVPGPNPDAEFYHGTHVAGLVGAEGGNGVGIVGTAYNGIGNPLVPIMPIISLPSGEAGSVMDLAQSILYAAGLENTSGIVPDQPARVINMSLGAAALPAEVSSFLHDIVRLASKADLLIVAAAGNDGENGIHCPACYPEVIAVGSIDGDRSRSWFSNHGAALELVAPGGVWYPASGELVAIFSTIPEDGYSDNISGSPIIGTSMATPLVAGVAAMVRAVNPGLTAAQVRTILQESAQDLGEPGKDDEFGYGLVDAATAVRRAAATDGGTVLRGQTVATIHELRLPPAESRRPERWNVAGSSTVAILLDPGVLADSSIEDPVQYVAKHAEIEVRGQGVLLRGLVPIGTDGDEVLRRLYELSLVRRAVQDRTVLRR